MFGKNKWEEGSKSGESKRKRHNTSSKQLDNSKGKEGNTKTGEGQGESSTKTGETEGENSIKTGETEDESSTKNIEAKNERGSTIGIATLERSLTKSGAASNKRSTKPSEADMNLEGKHSSMFGMNSDDGELSTMFGMNSDDGELSTMFDMNSDDGELSTMFGEALGENLSTEMKELFMKYSEALGQKFPSVLDIKEELSEMFGESRIKKDTMISETKGQKSSMPSQIKGQKSSMPSQIKGQKSYMPSETKGQKSSMPSQIKGQKSCLPSETKEQKSYMPSEIKNKAATMPVEIEKECDFPMSETNDEQISTISVKPKDVEGYAKSRNKRVGDPMSGNDDKRNRFLNNYFKLPETVLDFYLKLDDVIGFHHDLMQVADSNDQEGGPTYLVNKNKLNEFIKFLKCAYKFLQYLEFEAENNEVISGEELDHFLRLARETMADVKAHRRLLCKYRDLSNV